MAPITSQTQDAPAPQQGRFGFTSGGDTYLSLQFLQEIRQNWLFFLALGIWTAANFIQHTWFLPMLVGIVPFGAVRKGCLFLLVIFELLYGRRDKHSLIGLIVVASLIALAYPSGYNVALDGLCFIFVGRDVPFRTAACFAFVELSLLVAGTVVCAFLGFIPNIVYDSSPPWNRLELGFRHPNTAPAFSVYCFALWAYLRGEDAFCWKDVLFMFAFELALFRLTRSRTALVLTLLLIVLLFVCQRMPRRWLSSSVSACLLAGAVLIMACISLFLMFSYDENISWMVKLNQLLSNRYFLMYYARLYFGLSPFGRLIDYGTAANVDVFTGEWLYVEGAITVDNMYAHLLISCGALYFVAMILTCTFAAYKLFRQQEYILLTIIFVLAMYGLSEECSAFLYFNIFLLLLGTLMRPENPNDVPRS